MGNYRLIGDPKLKKYKSGLLATTTPITYNEINIFTLYVRGIKLSSIIDTARNMNWELDDVRVLNIVRKVGLKCLEMYRKEYHSPNISKEKQVFEDFVRGESLDQLAEKYGLPPFGIENWIKKTGKIYDELFRTQLMIKK